MFWIIKYFLSFGNSSFSKDPRGNTRVTSASLLSSSISPSSVSSSIYKKTNNYDEEYSSVLVRARSRNQTIDKDDLPVDLLVTRKLESRSNYRIDRGEKTNIADLSNLSNKKEATSEYYSDKNFSSYFLNSNPKLDQMLQKIEK